MVPTNRQLEENCRSGEATKLDETVKQKPEDPEKVSLRQYKNAMRLLFTVRRQRVVECGHRYNDNAQPRTNCPHCWFAFLNTHGEMVKMCDEIYMDQGKNILTALRGAKFVKMFERFMSTIARWKAENDAKGLNDTQAGQGAGAATEAANEAGSETSQTGSEAGSGGSASTDNAGE